ncbi:hypothetical protein HETIRDRAFT_422704 [Heterobasidion irregulare TC 32-1]|uniref:Uncharacterized protein n=1 Tax=Heterobasidion irregulare (strain TC 32-1) TaxID=747525 RepID=W4JRE5_HETIT|nr:uncharacterized protein HETIRDRAFT_422704 [Heterobasidion irregulare TC 32-1]ETW76113.1 hypothetical protein HETIRDRAFT_422704 [Heterobasidion irregulare TC 32-1]
MGKLKCEVEKAKCNLSSQQSTHIEIKVFKNGNDFSKLFTHTKFEELNLNLFYKTMKPVKQVHKDAGVKKKDIDEVTFEVGADGIMKVSAANKGI